jgi:hypothetical protein
MFMSKTHFEQIPLKIVRKIVEEQIRRETATQLSRGIEKKISEEDLLGGSRTIRGEADTRSN